MFIISSFHRNEFDILSKKKGDSEGFKKLVCEMKEIKDFISTVIENSVVTSFFCASLFQKKNRK